MALDPGTPVVADEIGNLFTKEALLTAIVEKRLPPGRAFAGCATSSLRLLPQPDDGRQAVADADAWSMDMVAYSCPIANVEMNGRLLRGAAPFLVVIVAYLLLLLLLFCQRR